METHENNPDSKQYTLGISVTKAQYDYITKSATDKHLSVSEYGRGLLARALRAELALEKTSVPANASTTSEDSFFDSLL